MAKQNQAVSFENQSDADSRFRQRISHAEIGSLRSATSRKPGLIRSILAAVAGAAKELFCLIAISSMDKNNSTCRYYGHEFDKNAWTDHLPTCMHCGTTINSINDVRKSTPQQ